MSKGTGNDQRPAHAGLGSTSPHPSLQRRGNGVQKETVGILNE